MCNDYRLKKTLEEIERQTALARLQILYSEGRPNVEPRDDVRITDRAPILRAAAGEARAAELIQRRWSWPGPGGKPVYNFRSDGRDFASGRCLIVADGFYEFTAPSEPTSKRKHKWLFTLKDEPWFCIAGLWRRDEKVGEAYTMLTTAPGPDVAPYHGRQVAVLHQAQWRLWLDEAQSVKGLIAPLPAGTLSVAAQ
jgi:putative SOS response-associated peptidase YedK